MFKWLLLKTNHFIQRYFAVFPTTLVLTYPRTCPEHRYQPLPFCCSPPRGLSGPWAAEIQWDFMHWNELNLRFRSSIPTSLFPTLTTLSLSSQTLSINQVCEVWSTSPQILLFNRFLIFFLLSTLDLYGTLGISPAIHHSIHPTGFRLQAHILSTVMSLVESGSITVPLWDKAGQPYPDNSTFLKSHVTSILSQGFAHVAPQQVRNNRSHALAWF